MYENRMTFLYFASDSFSSRAKVLTDSITKHHPEATIIHVKPNIAPDGSGYYLLGMAKKRLQKALELLEQGHDQVIIIGADCELFDRLRELRLVQMPDVTIVPHVKSPLPDRQYMAQIYNTGHANADLIAFQNTENSKATLRWLISVTEDGHTPGAFYEQTWLSSLPFLFGNVRIIRDKSYNVGYWDVNQFGVDNLTMFQYSGYEKGKPELMSRYSKEPAATQEIVDFYRAYDERIEK